MKTYQSKTLNSIRLTMIAAELPDYGDLMTVAEFVDRVKSGAFTERCIFFQVWNRIFCHTDTNG